MRKFARAEVVLQAAEFAYDFSIGGFQSEPLHNRRWEFTELIGRLRAGADGAAEELVRQYQPLTRKHILGQRWTEKYS